MPEYLILLATWGLLALAASWWCNCQEAPPGDPCSHCIDDETRPAVALIISNFSPIIQPCPCGYINGTFIIPQSAVSGCLYYDYPTFTCGITYFTSTIGARIQSFPSGSPANELGWQAAVTIWDASHVYNQSWLWEWHSGSTADFDCTVSRDLTYIGQTTQEPFFHNYCDQGANVPLCTVTPQ